MSSSKLTFKQRYDNDEEYKKKHLEYINERIPCECGKQITRVYMAKHLSLPKHKRDLERLNNNNINDINEIVKKLVKEELDKRNDLN